MQNNEQLKVQFQSCTFAPPQGPSLVFGCAHRAAVLAQAPAPLWMCECAYLQSLLDLFCIWHETEAETISALLWSLSAEVVNLI